MPYKFTAGQAFFAKIRFKDGEFPKYNRPYLIVSADGENLDVLNVSTVAGKEWKLTMLSNMELINYNPPFPKPSFVKLDSLQRIRLSDIEDVSPMCNGNRLCDKEMRKIMSSLKEQGYI